LFKTKEPKDWDFIATVAIGWRHDIQHNGIQHDDTQHIGFKLDDTQHDGIHSGRL
jgi:hypothetical protein